MEKILELQRELSLHPIYRTLNDLNGVRHFMRHHVFAVWDFMSLLKSLQREVTCVTVPWRPSKYPAQMVRLINQIVVGEESDVDEEGVAISHFDLYLKAMEEVGAPTSEIRDFLMDMNQESIPAAARSFVANNLDVAMHGHVIDVAAGFFYGREKLIPDMFQSIVEVLNKENVYAPTLVYYLKRHIEVDGGDHGPLALKFLDHLVAEDETLRAHAYAAGEAALLKRRMLWDQVLDNLPS
jgi:hypothetical protein